MFARRTAWELGENALARRRAALERAGVPLLDLTESNPTRCEFTYPPELWQTLADPAAAAYDPSPLGWLPAREAVARGYADKGAAADPRRIVLTASTSESYSFLFRLLADPGDAILVPRPSYPLFDYLAGLHDVEPVAYPLAGGGPWRYDVDALRAALTPRTRAVVVVHPNHPTGSVLSGETWAALAALCADRGIAVIADEVFADYLVEPARVPRTLLSGTLPVPGTSLYPVPETLVFALGGLSKFLALPQMKLGWLAIGGPPALVEPALARLELIADTFLSVNTPAQRALPRWLAHAPAIQHQLRERIAENRQWLRGLTHGSDPFDVLASDGGWAAVVRVPGLDDEEAFALECLEQARLMVHPGYFYDVETPGHLVLSLLPPTARFREGVARLRQVLEKRRAAC
ncbi:MAG: pyridoxal phosphate-dependent aminotransferase [Candidatus Omnitrophica bacterium]|nr:pyridoxal phosphate-dependent aminotransferase [Candidatus Omnitrophota bacterium]